MTDRPQFASARAMRFYIAGRYDRREELQREAQFLECFGHQSTARWLTGAHEKQGDDSKNFDVYTLAELGQYAARDIEDIRAADILIAYTESPDVGYTSGGRHVEFGYAAAIGLKLAIIGPRENVFMQIDRQAPDLRTLIAIHGSTFPWVPRRNGGDDE
jgi:nucleoside 2-deoxyribosyltransferase